jgi:hypothetical protein
MITNPTENWRDKCSHIKNHTRLEKISMSSEFILHDRICGHRSRFLSCTQRRIRCASNYERRKNWKLVKTAALNFTRSKKRTMEENSYFGEGGALCVRPCVWKSREERAVGAMYAGVVMGQHQSENEHGSLAFHFGRREQLLGFVKGREC